MNAKLLLAVFSVLFVVSCAPDEPAEPVVPVAPLLYKSTTTGMAGIPEICEYFYSGNQLTLISCTSGERTFTYIADQIVQIDVTHEGSSWTEYFDYDDQGRVLVHRKIGEAYGFKDVYHYAQDNTALVERFSGGVTIQETFVEMAALEFDVSGEIIRCKFGGITSDYAYDDKYCATRNIAGFGPMSSLISHNMMGVERNPNQFSRRTLWGIESFEKYIEYNADHYPVFISVSDPLDGETLLVTYEYYP